jgi:DNA gyrase subunit A
MRVLKLAGRERQQLSDDYDEMLTCIAGLESVLASPVRQRELISTEQGDYLAGQGNRPAAETTGGDETG